MSLSMSQRQLMADLASVVVCCQPGETLPRNLGVAGNGWLDSCVAPPSPLVLLLLVVSLLLLVVGDVGGVLVGGSDGGRVHGEDVLEEDGSGAVALGVN